MEFINPEIDLENIPRAEEVSFKAVEPEYYHVIRFSWLLSILVLAAILFAVIFFVPKLQKPHFMVIAGGIWLTYTISRYILDRKAFQNLSYAIRGHDLIHRSGWFVERIRTAPFNRVQHSNVTAGPLERRYDLATLILYTAGTEGADIRIAGLKREDAFRLKDWITQKVLDEK